MTTQVAEIGIAAARTLAETGGEVETIAKTEEWNGNEMFETGFAMIETGAAMIETGAAMIETGVAMIETGAAATTAAMTVIGGTKEIGGMKEIGGTAGIGGTIAISAAIGTGGVAMVARLTTIDAALTARILRGEKNRRGRGSFQLRKKIGFGDPETKTWSSSRSRSRVGICGTRKLRVLVLTQSTLKGIRRSLLTDSTMRVRRMGTAVSGGEGSGAKTRSPSRKGPACTWMRSMIRRLSGGRGAH
jgi:hypothetical protein